MILKRYIPSDILRIILDLLLGDIKNKPCFIKIQKSLINNLSLIDKQFNELTNLYLPNCHSQIIKFGNRKWCKVHNKNEWVLANYISKNKNNFVKLENDYDFSKGIHFDKVHSENYLRCLFNVVTDGMNYRFSHSCCSGKGIMFYV